MELDRNTMLSTMYQNDEETTENNPVSANLSNNRTRKIRVGIIEYEVPTVEYMRQLEQMVLHHTRIIHRQQYFIDRIDALLRNQNYGSDIDALRRDLATKINKTSSR